MLNQLGKCVITLLMATTIGFSEDAVRGTVHVVVAVDTEPMLENSTEFSSELNLANFDSTGSEAFVQNIMEQSFRSEYRDSYGGNIRFTFFIETSEAICNSENSECGAVYEAMKKFRGPMNLYGDELGWHNHHIEWIEADFDPGNYFWSQIITFDGSEYRSGTDVENTEKMLNHLLVDQGFFPTSFRAGWLWENTDFSNWIDEIVPFDFSNLSPLGGSAPPCSTVFWEYFDWSRAPVGWTYFRPSRDDYQVPGDCKRTIFRCDCDGMFQSHLRSAFEEAATGKDVYVCAYTHARASIVDFLDQQRFNLLDVYSEQFDVPFRYSTAVQAARTILGIEADTIPPVLTVEKLDRTLRIITNENIFQEIPYCAMKHGAKYERVRPTPIAHSMWEVELPASSDHILVVAVSDYAGNAATARYVKEGGL